MDYLRIWAEEFSDDREKDDGYNKRFLFQIIQKTLNFYNIPIYVFYNFH